MRGRLRAILVGVVLVLIATGCTSAQGPTAPSSGQNPPPPPSAPKRITVAVSSDFNTLSRERGGLGNRPGLRDVEQLVHAGLSVKDSRGILQARLAEDVPSAENGLWKLFADGRMETTWRLRAGTFWHDGTPLTAEDLVFTAGVGQDREVPQFRDPALNQVERVAAPDSRTLVVTWKQPFIEAASLFAATSSAQFLPMPRHLLEATYQENKAGLAELPYWSDGFVGAGPYRVAGWLFGSSLTLEANGQYVLGRPKIDVIDVRFFGDPNALYAAVLADDIDVPLGHRALSFEQAVTLKEQWKGGVIGFDPAAPLAFWPQLHNPNPAVIGDARFRRALLHAIDRQEMANTLGGGYMPVADTFILPDAPEYAVLQASAVRYDYDPRKTTQIIEGLGYTKASDGFFRDAEGPLRVEIRSSLQDNNRRAKLAAADYWQKAGVAVTPVDDPDSRRRDIPYRATFPGFETRGGYGSVEDFKFFHSSEARLPEKSYVGVSVTNYMNGEMDALVERYFVTIPQVERMQVAEQIVRHLTDQVIGLSMFYDAEPTVVGQRLRNVATAVVNGAANTWNVHEWDAD